MIFRNFLRILEIELSGILHMFFLGLDSMSVFLIFRYLTFFNTNLYK